MRRTPRRIARIRHALVAALLCACVTGTATACTAADAQAESLSATHTLRLGYFDTVTHAPALVAVHKKFFASALGATGITTEKFAAGPAAIEALSAGAIDAAYLGPSPAINSYTASAGASLRVVSGVANGGAALVVNRSIRGVADLKGAVLASPQLGNTQDVALRTWLKTQDLSSSLTGGGDVAITPTGNAQILRLFVSGGIDGAWVPEPWASRLQLEPGAHVLVDERTQWPSGEFPTTVLVVGTDYLKFHPHQVAALIEANQQAINWLNNRSDATAAAVIDKQVTADTGATLGIHVIEQALKNVDFTADPLASTFGTQLTQAQAEGLAKKGSLKHLFDLRILNESRVGLGEAPILTDGLGVQ